MNTNLEIINVLLAQQRWRTPVSASSIVLNNNGRQQHHQTNITTMHRQTTSQQSRTVTSAKWYQLHHEWRNEDNNGNAGPTNQNNGRNRMSTSSVEKQNVVFRIMYHEWHRRRPDNCQEYTPTTFYITRIAAEKYQQSHVTVYHYVISHEGQYRLPDNMRYQTRMGHQYAVSNTSGL